MKSVIAFKPPYLDVTNPFSNMYLYYVLVKNSSVTELLQVWDILVQLGLESSRKNMKILVIS